MPTWREKKVSLEDHPTTETSVALPLARFIFREDGEYIEKTTRELFRDKRVAIFGVPGAFTPTCTNNQVPDFEQAYDELIAAGVDEVYCISINDSFVMNAWRESLGVKKVKFIPDGNGFFTRQLGKSVFKANLGFGVRSWRYSAIVDSDLIEVIFSEEGQVDNCEQDPYEWSKPNKLLAYLKDVPRRSELDSDDDHDALDELSILEREIFLNTKSAFKR